MATITIGGRPPATMLVEGNTNNPVPVLISNIDPVNILYIGDNASMDSTQMSSSTPIAPGQFVVASGLTNVYAIAATGSQVVINVMPGFTSFFQPITQLIVQGTNSGIFIYNGTPAANNLIGSWSSVAGVDRFGNPYPQGVNVQSGSLTGVSLNSSAFVAGTIMSTLISGSQMQSSKITGGTITETVITFDSGGGGLWLYSTSTTTQTFVANGTFTGPPASVPTFRVQTWGPDSGGGGGTASVGGEAGGGGEYGEEPAYPNYRPGGSYNVQVGAKGLGGPTNSPGASSGQSSFDGTGVQSQGGQAGSNGVGGQGGNYATATIHFKGGNGGGNPGNFATSAGGGGRAGSTGAGGNGQDAQSNATPGTGGAAGTGVGGIAGSNGVASGLFGISGNGGGSGAGKGGTGTTFINKFYDPISTDAWYGVGVGGGLHDHNGVMYQGCPNSGLNNFPGDETSYAKYDHARISSDFAGATIDSTALTIHNIGSWYSTGCYLILSYQDAGGDHYTGNYYWVNNGSTPSIDVSAPLNAQVKNLLAIKIGPSALTGSPTSLYNYGYFTGGAGAGGPRLSIAGHIGSAGLFYGGDGSDGKVVVSYQTSDILVGGLSPTVQTDGSGNSLAAGYTGPVQALNSASSPKTVEVWHAVSLATGVTGSIRCKKVAELNMVILDVNVSWSGLTAQTFILGALPDSSYYPTNLPPGNARVYPLGSNSTTPAAYAATTFARVFIPGSGNLNIIVPATSVVPSNASCTITYPTD